MSSQPIESILVIAALLLLASILASVASSRLGIPALLLFLLIGTMAGSEGPGGIEFDDPWLAQFLGVIALTFILFDGGLRTYWVAVRQVLWSGIALSTMGVLLTAVLVGLFASMIFGFGLLEGILLGAIVSSTDAAAVFSILRSRSVGLKGNLSPLLELESGSNDPMVVFLTLGIIGLLLSPEASLWSIVPLFFRQMLLGGLLGYGLGRWTVWLLNRSRLEYEGLYPVLTTAMVLLTYGLTAYLGGNGFLAVYITGLVMGNSNFVHKKSLIRFHDGQAWLMQIAMFLTLGLLVFPSHVTDVAREGLLVAAFLILAARPLSVLITLLPARLTLREKLLVAWVGLRGRCPSSWPHSRCWPVCPRRRSFSTSSFSWC